MGIHNDITVRQITRRGLIQGGLALAGAGALGLSFSRNAGAQEGTAAAGSGLDALGLPEITITATDTGYDGLPDSVKAGRYLVSVTNNVTNQGTDSAVAAFLQLPDGVTAETMIPATPAATPGAESDSDNTPTWFYTTALAGGPSASPKKTVRGVIDLTPGNWVVWNEDTETGAKTAAFTVTEGDSSASSMPEPAASVTIDEVNTADGFAFQVNGTLQHGQQVLKIVNQSDEPHFFLMVGSPVPLTMDQVQTLLSLPDGATPEPSSGLPDPSTLETGVYAGTQSKGVTQWIEANLDLDTYVLLCFIGDPKKGGIPHAFEGMVDIVTVGEAMGTPAA